MKSKYKVVFFITILLVILSLSISTVNYYVSLESAQKHLKNQSLPLSLDNIYSDIQKHIIQPYLVSSMMANDTFLQDWLVNEEHNVNKISRYLENIKNKYHMFNAFLVSEKTKKYYTQNGFLEVLNKDNAANNWYFNFLSTEKKHEINLDFNKYLSNSLIMFINYKILDKDLNLIGVTGLALKISYIDDLLKKFRKKHNFIVTFYNSQGDIVLAEREITKEKNIDEIVELKKYKNLILSKKSVLLEYSKGLEQYILNTKYIPELDLYLTVKANLEDFTYDVKKILYFNLFVSLLITFIIATIIYFIIKNYSNKL
ncbi:cache domain-containing protein [Halarcobacter mediterraneus]|uniref:cache domain-containing protein n=1 Tax=Halarcobacter mediterraneus TaxID=2023153 RepID=UPI001E52C025|nr:cache domain-containing protein [Halarcobacter mediterraneus]